MNTKTFIPREMAAQMSDIPAGDIYVDGKRELSVVGSVPIMREPSQIAAVLNELIGAGFTHEAFPRNKVPPMIHVDDRTPCQHGAAERIPGHDVLAICAEERTVMSCMGTKLDRHRDRYRVLVTAGDFGPDGEWQHASISRRGQVPSYEDLKALHLAAFGEDAWSYQVFTPTVDHVNIHSFTLHLWGKVDRSRHLPNFGALGSI